MPISPKTSKWIKVAKILAENPLAKIGCPECGTEPLRVKDVPWEKDSRFFERYLICPSCGAKNVMRKEVT